MRLYPPVPGGGARWVAPHGEPIAVESMWVLYDASLVTMLQRLTIVAELFLLGHQSGSRSTRSSGTRGASPFPTRSGPNGGS